MTKYTATYEDFQKALASFEEILKEQPSDIVHDSAIKRFEIVFDLSWKTIKAFLEEYHSVYCASPQGCVRDTFRVGLIPYDVHWIEIAKLRNLTIHTYSKALADDAYTKLPDKRCMIAVGCGGDDEIGCLQVH